MAKVAFSKLGLKINNDVKTVVFNEQTIEVKQYLPIEEKLNLITSVINYSADENNFANPIKVDVYTALEIIESYTNITFTDKQKENAPKLYDMIICTGLYKTVVQTIPTNELDDLINAISHTIEAIYTYRNSAMGILDIITADYSDLKFDAESIRQNLADANNMEFLKNVLSNLG